MGLFGRMEGEGRKYLALGADDLGILLERKTRDGRAAGTARSS